MNKQGARKPLLLSSFSLNHYDRGEKKSQTLVVNSVPETNDAEEEGGHTNGQLALTVSSSNYEQKALATSDEKKATDSYLKNLTWLQWFVYWIPTAAVFVDITIYQYFFALSIKAAVKFMFGIDLDLGTCLLVTFWCNTWMDGLAIDCEENKAMVDTFWGEPKKIKVADVDEDFTMFETPERREKVKNHLNGAKFLVTNDRESIWRLQAGTGYLQAYDMKAYGLTPEQLSLPNADVAELIRQKLQAEENIPTFSWKRIFSIAGLLFIFFNLNNYVLASSDVVAVLDFTPPDSPGMIFLGMFLSLVFLNLGEAYYVALATGWLVVFNEILDDWRHSRGVPINHISGFRWALDKLPGKLSTGQLILIGTMNRSAMGAFIGYGTYSGCYNYAHPSSSPSSPSSSSSSGSVSDSSSGDGTIGDPSSLAFTMLFAFFCVAVCTPTTRGTKAIKRYHQANYDDLTNRQILGTFSEVNWIEELPSCFFIFVSHLMANAGLIIFSIGSGVELSSGGGVFIAIIAGIMLLAGWMADILLIVKDKALAIQSGNSGSEKKVDIITWLTRLECGVSASIRTLGFAWASFSAMSETAESLGLNFLVFSTLQLIGLVMMSFIPLKVEYLNYQPAMEGSVRAINGRKKIAQEAENPEKGWFRNIPYLRHVSVARANSYRLALFYLPDLEPEKYGITQKAHREEVAKKKKRSAQDIEMRSLRLTRF